MIILSILILSTAWIIFELIRAPYMDDEGNFTDKFGNKI